MHGGFVRSIAEDSGSFKVASLVPELLSRRYFSSRRQQSVRRKEQSCLTS